MQYFVNLFAFLFKMQKKQISIQNRGHYAAPPVFLILRWYQLLSFDEKNSFTEVSTFSKLLNRHVLRKWISVAWNILTVFPAKEYPGYDTKV